MGSELTLGNMQFGPSVCDATLREPVYGKEPLTPPLEAKMSVTVSLSFYTQVGGGKTAMNQRLALVIDGKTNQSSQ